MIKNPILPGFHPDPSILRIYDTYYIAVSSFEWFPGIPIYESKDLKHWTLCNHAVTRTTQADLKGVSSAMGIWAPSLSWNEEEQRVYLTYSIVYGCEDNNFDVDNYVIYTNDIKGNWSDAIYLNSSGFDPSMFHDGDGKSYVMNLRWEFRQGYEHPGVIVLQEYDRKKQCLIGDISIISKGATDRGCLEGPNIYYKNGYYYLITAEGGTGFGHCVAVSRSRNVRGPYESYEHNPIVTSCPENFNERGVPDSAKPWRYVENSYLQKSGHGSIVETKAGEVYIAHLCSRPITKNHRSVLGRETALQRCEWTKDGWIQMQDGTNIAKEMVPEAESLMKTQEEVSRKDSFFYSLREPIPNQFIRYEPDGSIVMTGRATLFGKYEQSLLAQKIEGFCYRAEVFMKAEPKSFLQMSGLVNYYNNQNFYYLRLYYSESLGGKCLGIMSADQGKKKEYNKDRILIPENIEWIGLRTCVTGQNLQYEYSLDGRAWNKIGPILDSTILSDEYAHGFTGSFVGICVQDLYNHSFSAMFRQFCIDYTE